MFAVHADVLPLHRERALVVHVVQRDNDLLEIDVTPTDRAEIPETARIAEVRVTAKDASLAIPVAPPDILHMRVEDTRAEGADEFHVVHPLITQVRRIVIEAETFVILHGGERAL